MLTSRTKETVHKKQELLRFLTEKRMPSNAKLKLYAPCRMHVEFAAARL